MVVRAQRGLTRGTSPQGPGTPPWEDGKSCPSGGRCSRRACEGQQSPRTGHTSLGGWGLLPRWWSVVHGAYGGQQSPRPGHTSLGGRGVLPKLVVAAQGGPTGGSSPQDPGTLGWGDGKSRPSAGRCSRRACEGQQSPGPGHTSLGGWGLLPRWWSVLHGACGGQQSPRPGHTRLGGRGLLPKRWSLFKDGLRGGSSPQGPGTLAWGDGESSPSGGRCSRRACEGQPSPRLGHTSLGGRGAPPRWWSVRKESLRGAPVPNARAHQPGGTGSPVQAVVAAQGGPAGGNSPQGPGTLALGDGDSCPSGGRCSRRACEGQQSPTPGHTTLRGQGVLPTW